MSTTFVEPEASLFRRWSFEPDFEKPLPTLRVTGGKALRFAGGGYSVSDWIHD